MSKIRIRQRKVSGKLKEMLDKISKESLEETKKKMEEEIA